MNQHKGKTLDVAKDPLDLRDLYYEGSLLDLPPWLDNRGKVPFVLDQGDEGACTGFGLAAVVNFNLHNKAGAQILKPTKGASSRMLYELAKRYDEWEGTNYEGSSIRAAMKGWHKHGVCREAMWPYRPGKKTERLTSKRQIDALDVRLGNYFRVRHRHLNHVHSALAEAGVLYASADIHDGWFKVNKKTGQIPYSTTRAGGHAFAIVGFDEDGLWIQNSWGYSWGLNGFAHLPYDDWFENSYDCWVARLGVKTKSLALSSGEGLFGRVLSFDHIPHEAVVHSQIKPHYINLGNDGKFSDKGNYQTDPKDVEDMFQHITETTENWSGKPNILLYAHGGLNNEKASAQRVASMLPYYLGNDIYPIHFMWETGIWESIRGIVQDAFRNRRFAGKWDLAKDKFFDLIDEAIELASRTLGYPIWSQMKDNAESASNKDGGAYYLAKKLADYKLNDQDFNLHLVGHSAGSILLGHLISELEMWNLQIKTVTLYAPACTLDFFESNYVPYIENGSIKRSTIFNLKDEVERDDEVAKIYNKSLLYLVSEAFEKKRKKPLLGMEKYTKKNNVFKSIYKKPVKTSKSTVCYSIGGANVTLKSLSTTHGGFDNDVDTLNSTLRIVLSSNSIKKPFININN